MTAALPVIPSEPSGPAAVPARVALVNMPFARADSPSIQCGLLKAELVEAGHEAEVFYLNLELAARFGADVYDHLAHLPKNVLLGDWLFSVAAFGYRPNEAAYHEAGSRPISEACSRLGVDFEGLCRWRNELFPSWVEQWADEIDWSLYAAVGFTTTFDQTAASFALARRIKQRHPDVAVIFGGANFDGEMGREFVRALGFIDYACIGEGDVALPAMINRIARGESALGVAGVIGRSHGALVEKGAPAPAILDLDRLPDPDYDDYFSTLFRLRTERVLGPRPPVLLFEAARGCWWGEKQHCTFCGMNRDGLRFRSKTPAEVAGQLRRLSSRYKLVRFVAVDSILDYRYLEDLLGPLAERRFDYQLFYEVKSNLKPAQLRRLAHAGVKRVQPGIESLNSHILRLMRKGVTMLQNVRFLKWARYYGIGVHWGILTGFPGETEEDYRQQREVVRRLRHLPPPKGAMRIWLERFSPYFSDGSFPVKNIRPLAGYRFVYPEEGIDLGRIAYFFDYEMESTVADESHEELRALVAGWQKGWERRPRPSLVYQRSPDWIQILDRRSEEPAVHGFEGPEAAIYEYCSETDHSFESVRRHVGRGGDHGSGSGHGNGNGVGLDEPQIRAALERFCDLGLMLEENGRFLSLALPANPRW